MMYVQVLDGLNKEGDEVLSDDDLSYGDEEEGEGEIDEETLKKLKEQGYDLQGDNDDDEDDEFDQYGDEEEGEDDLNDDDYDDEDDEEEAPAPKRAKK